MRVYIFVISISVVSALTALIEMAFLRPGCF